ncbi:hypothetical protein [Paracoccus sp. T5]|uniref:hypothetical protein n=1 Tax=Paracoccus sp. T5 TaxID=3402161 RepID=UPI003AD99A19
MPTRYTNPRDCRVCTMGQRLSTLGFAIFAVALMVARLDPMLSHLQRTGLAVCALLCAIAVFRNPISWVAGRVMPGHAGSRSGIRKGRS